MSYALHSSVVNVTDLRIPEFLDIVGQYNVTGTNQPHNTCNLMDCVSKYHITAQDFVDLSYWLLKASSIFEDNLPASRIDEYASFVDEADILMELEEEPMKQESQNENNNICLLEKLPSACVRFLNIQDVYEKVQSRAGGGSSQRIAMGSIRISAVSEGQIYGLEVCVQKLPEAAVLSGEEIKRVPLRTHHEAHFKNQQTFSVDLDSVYNDPNGEPVYKLATVDIEKRNLFVLIVHVVFIDNKTSGPFVSKPFLIRTRKSANRKST